MASRPLRFTILFNSLSPFQKSWDNYPRGGKQGYLAWAEEDGTITSDDHVSVVRYFETRPRLPSQVMITAILWGLLMLPLRTLFKRGAAIGVRANPQAERLINNMYWLTAFASPPLVYRSVSTFVSTQDEEWYASLERPRTVERALVMDAERYIYAKWPDRAQRLLEGTDLQDEGDSAVVDSGRFREVETSAPDESGQEPAKEARPHPTDQQKHTRWDELRGEAAAAARGRGRTSSWDVLREKSGRAMVPPSSSSSAEQSRRAAGDGGDDSESAQIPVPPRQRKSKEQEEFDALLERERSMSK